tara:strand:+ start:679 stop:948 length:270 start_codon:yes stop_codon:yes gene_type:complete
MRKSSILLFLLAVSPHMGRVAMGMTIMVGGMVGIATIMVWVIVLLAVVMPVVMTMFMIVAVIIDRHQPRHILSEKPDKLWIAGHQMRLS